MATATQRTASPLLNRSEASEFLRISPATLHRLIHRPKVDNPLPVRQVGKRHVFHVDDLLAWTEEETRRHPREQARRKQRRKSPSQVGGER